MDKDWKGWTYRLKDYDQQFSGEITWETQDVNKMMLQWILDDQNL
jgi:hypothetical protein